MKPNFFSIKQWLVFEQRCRALSKLHLQFFGVGNQQGHLGEGGEEGHCGDGTTDGDRREML